MLPLRSCHPPTSRPTSCRCPPLCSSSRVPYERFESLSGASYVASAAIPVTDHSNDYRHHVSQPREANALRTSLSPLHTRSILYPRANRSIVWRLPSQQSMVTDSPVNPSFPLTPYASRSILAYTLSVCLSSSSRPSLSYVLLDTRLEPRAASNHLSSRTLPQYRCPHG